ncbi:hypothetical protein ID987_001645 [Salmonella enterica]|nr:hypothetical protein [Salmonella enterica]
MISPIRQSLFERAANLPAVSARELALMLCALEPHLTTAAIPDDKHEYYDIFLHQIIRQIKSAGCFPPGRNSQTHSADEMFALAYLMIDEEITPKPVQERCLRAVAAIAKRNKARDLLMQLGGQQLLECALELRRNQRGQYRKAAEQENTYRLLFLLLSLLVKNANGTYGTLDSPRLSNLYRDLQTLAEDEGFSSEGLSRATIYNKLKSALSVQHRHAD